MFASRLLLFSVIALSPLGVGCTTSTMSESGSDASSGADAVDGSNSNTDATCTVPTCTPVKCYAPLEDGCDGGCPSFGSSTDLATLCAQYPGHVLRSSKACNGTKAISVGTGIDCNTWYLFDDTTSAALAVAGQCNSLVRCAGGTTGYVVDPTCFFNNAYDLVPACPTTGDAGDGGAPGDGSAD